MADGLIFHNNNLFAFNVYFNRVVFANSQLVAKLLGNDQTAELIDVSDNACGFHYNKPFSCLCLVFARLIPDADARRSVRKVEIYYILTHTRENVKT